MAAQMTEQRRADQMNKQNPISEMWGDRAVQAPFGFVCCRTDPINGIERTMIGGVVFDGFGNNHWERWRGTMILIPRFIDRTKAMECWAIQDLMMQGINRDVTEEEMQRRESAWKPVWRPLRR